MAFQILILEDDKLLADYLSSIVAKFHRPFVCYDLESAKKALKNVNPDLVFTDLNLSKERSFEGLDMVSACKEMNIPSIVLTSHGEEEVIQQAFERGCSHYLVKDEFEAEVERIIKTTLGEPSENFLKENLHTTSKEFKSQAKSLLERSHNRELPILLTGETGVGKTHLAKLIHDYNQANAPFITKNLSELSDNVVESELFGHKKGAFTGALEDRKGWIEQADGGTLFLDEIGSLSPKVQQKLLKVIEEKTLTPVGSTKAIRVNFRLITATCEDLQEKIENGEFRIDFYFRIKGIDVNIPPLRQRVDDIDQALKSINSIQKRKLFFTLEAIALLKDHSWPGNFRELHSLVKTLQSGNESLITPEQIQTLLTPAKSSKEINQEELLTPKINNDILTHGLPEAIKKLENEAFKKIVALHGMKPNKICDRLKISKSVFYRLQSQLEAIHG